MWRSTTEWFALAWLVAFLLPTIWPLSFLGFAVRLNTRWAVLALGVLVVLRQWRRIALPYEVLFGVLAFGGYAMSTALFSEIPELSLSKGGAVLAVMLVGLSLGRLMARSGRTGAPILIIGVGLVIGNVVAGVLSPGRSWESGNFRGVVGNSNMCGFAVAIGLAGMAWAASRIAVRKRRPMRVLGIAAVVELLMTFSRGAMVLAATGFAVERAVRRKYRESIILGVALAGLAVGLGLFAPRTLDDFAYRFIYKNQDSLFVTREENFRETYKAAREVGLLGAGYGVSEGMGDEVDLGRGTAVGYGREKGNGYLALYEEVGLPGVLLFAYLVAAVLFHGLRTSVAGSDFLPGHPLSDAAPFFGLVCGLLMVNNVEAWLTAPASVESAVFWYAAGTILHPGRHAFSRAQTPARR